MVPQEQTGNRFRNFWRGKCGAALTTLFAPSLLNILTENGNHLEGWRMLPKIYAAILLIMGIMFLIFTENKKPATSDRTLRDMLQPLKKMRVWRFGMYYFLVFGCFVAFSQWLVPYFVNVYYLPLVTAGIFASLFSFPSGVIRALGGWMSDKLGARRVMYWVFGASVVIAFLLIVPKMEVYSPGRGIMASSSGTVTEIKDSKIIVDGITYELIENKNKDISFEDGTFILPTKEVWQEPVVKVGDKVQKKQLLAKGITRIYFQANVWVFAILVILIGSIWGIGKAGVYKLIPDYFPEEVGVVGGMVGVIGGLGGFFCPIIFGYLLEGTGLWTSSWMFILLLSVLCLFWMHSIIQKMMHKETPELMRKIESD